MLLDLAVDQLADRLCVLGVLDAEPAVLGVPDGPIFAEEHAVRDRLEVQGTAQHVGPVDYSGIGGACPLDPGSGGLCPLRLQGNGHQLEVIAAMLLVETLPAWQLLATPSPRAPHEQEHLLAA